MAPKRSERAKVDADESAEVLGLHAAGTAAKLEPVRQAPGRRVRQASICSFVRCSLLARRGAQSGSRWARLIGG